MQSSIRQLKDSAAGRPTNEDDDPAIDLNLREHLRLAKLLKKRAEDTMFIDAAIQRSILIPIGLGSKYSSLPFKVRGLLHALLMQYGVAMFGKSRAEAVAVTADLGTEIGVAEFHCKSCYSCLPPWQRAELGADDDQADPLESEQPVFDSAMAVAGEGPCEKLSDIVAPSPYIWPPLRN